VAVLAPGGTTPPIPPEASPAVHRPGDGWPAWFTFRRGPDGVPEEDRTQRGLHPMVAERLGLWRFSRFELTRLPAAPDVHLFRIRGREVPDDQRLMVLADVRDLTICATRTDGSAACRSSSAPWTPAWTACARPVRPTASWPGWTGTGSSSTSGRSWTPRSTEFDQVIRSLAPRTEGLGLEQVMVQLRWPPRTAGSAS
jgi:hypothetical protein